MILVTGATGKTGSRVLSRLCDLGVDVRAQVHSADRADLVPAGAEVVVADFDDPAALDAAVSGCAAVYLVSPPGPEQLRRETAVIEAVVRARTGAHVVKVAVVGVGDPRAGRLAVQHGQICERLADSGLPWTVLAPSELSLNLFLYAEPVLTLGILPVPAADGRVTWLDADDLAAVAVATLTRPGHAGRTYEVTGPQALHHAEVAQLLSHALATPVRYVNVPAEQAMAAMLAAGLGEWLAAGLVEFNGFAELGGVRHVRDVVTAVGGVRPTPLGEFVERAVPTFRALVDRAGTDPVTTR